VRRVEEVLKRKEEEGEELLKRINDLDRDINMRGDKMSSLKAKTKKDVQSI